jgi:hypothetical protein
MVYYPNPFDDHFYVNTGNGDTQEVYLSVFSHSGRLILSGDYQLLDGSIRIEASHWESGIYFVSMIYNNTQSTFEIIKK